MKRIAFFALALLLAAACQRELVGEKEGREALDEPEFYATIEAPGAADTKVFADENMKVLWNADDRIVIFKKSTLNEQYRFTGSEGANYGGFKLVPDPDADEFVTGNDLDYYYAVYPYDAAMTISNKGVLNVTLPARQLYKERSFGMGANTMVSVGTNNVLKFKNAGGYLAFKLFGDNVKVSSITLEGNNHEKLSGAAQISMQAGGQPTVVMRENASESVSLVCESPVSIGSSESDYTEFWFVLPPTTFTQGFTVTVNTDNGGVFSKSVSSQIVVDRNSLMRMAALEVVPEDGGEMVPPDNEIWYVTADGTLIDLEASYPLYNSTPFDSEVVSHSYENGKGIIRCAGPITVLNDHVFGNSRFPEITQLYLPNSIEKLEAGALRGLQIEELRIPDNLKSVGSYALHLPSLRRFTGKHTSADGRCVIIEDGFMPYYGNTLVPVQNYMAAFAPVGVVEYTIPENVQILGGYVFWRMELKVIRFNEGLQAIMGDCFAESALDCDIVFPSTLESLDTYAFRECTGITGFYGNEQFHTADHMCLTAYNGKWIVKFVGMDLTDYTIPEGITGIENYTFSGATKLLTVTFPSSLESIGASAFINCPNLEMIYGDCVSEDHKAVVFGTVFSRLVVTKGITHYTVPEGITALAYSAFTGCNNLEEITLPDSVLELGGYDFAWCHNLKKVTLSARLERVSRYNPFLDSSNLEAIYFRSIVPPSYSDTQFDARDCEHLTVYVPEESLDAYKTSGWNQYAPYMVGYHYDDLGEITPDYYISSDFSHDGEVTTLQTATVGQGIHLVLMGDAYSDREIADGSYAKVMRQAMDAFFSEAPYKSFKDRFTVSVVNVVSQTEGYEHGGQSLSTAFGDGTYVYGNDDKVMDYARRVVPEEEMGEALIIVMMNKDAYAGTCFMYYPSGEGDFGNGLSIAYFPASSDVDTFNGLVSHEAGGHGFAKLGDEYAYEYMGHVDENEINFLQSMDAFGWCRNVDITDDPLTVKWAAFIADNRYAAEKIGCYEGADTYWTGVWRPTENSIMRYNWGGFNAPSRYAIWNRIGKLSNGTDWNGTYEDFVSYDAVNRSSAAVRQAATRNCVEKQLPPLHPPVVIPHPWNAK